MADTAMDNQCSFCGSPSGGLHAKNCPHNPEVRRRQKELEQKINILETQYSTTLENQLHQERERAEQYEEILRKLVEAQDEIDVEAEKPLHQRSKVPVAKKNEAIEEARRAWGGE